jgi:hypothetical protein
MRSLTPTVSCGDSLSIGQLADSWDKSTEFVHGLVSNGDLAVDDRGLITNSELHRFYQAGGQALLEA